MYQIVMRINGFLYNHHKFKYLQFTLGNNTDTHINFFIC